MVSAAPAMLRNARERVIQTLWFEGVGIALVAPLYGALAGTSISESVMLLGALSLAALAWSAGFNVVFDHIEARSAGRAASDRPQALRVAHAFLHEASEIVVTCPLIVALTDLGWVDALVTDLLLTLAYVGYAYLFFLTFDRIRPVQPHRAAVSH